ncbi:tetratricopeptide repeat protein [Arcticibacterium luteifluviistationis]|uniref:Uncharacterized protein n=1 Tax=Arcticibacterium luteifluviistationis TaxID=1784714 RepID=A0A2Z4G769_9BACT|nr:hypothetical protein [Arcticibacterium luteifluviistationis]AWV97036.1 hypothetical protein DJ013_02120 [Arcticibacterium luteifluviistationis]
MSKIEQKRIQLQEWHEKLDFFKEKEAQTSDLDQQWSARKRMKEAEQNIEKLENEIKALDKISERKEGINPTDEVSNIETVSQAIDLYLDGLEKLDHRSSFEELEKTEQLRYKLFEELFSSHKDKIKSTSILQNKFIYTLFENIFSAEKLPTLIINDINDVRTDKESYKHYDRSIIVSALTLSVLSWKVFDPNKIGLLIDFLTDYEKGVWERSLTGIILSSIMHQNRLQRYQLTGRLVELQKNEKIQIGIYIIDTILRNQLYKNVIFPKGFEKEEFLNDTPYNWFFPFYEGNPNVLEMFKETEQDIDENDFLQYIINVPLVSSFKYTLCNGIKNNQITISKKSFDKNSAEDLARVYSLNMASDFEPFYNLIAEYYLYFKFYPKDRVKEIFEHKITLAQTKLKNIILSKVQELKLSADLLFEKNEYNSCIKKLKELLNIEPNQLSALIQISECHEEKNEFSEALSYHYEIEKNKPNNYVNQLRIGFCLNQTKQYKKSIEYLLKANSIKPNKIKVISLIGNNYLKLKDFQKSIEFHEKALQIDEKYEFSLMDLNTCYSTLKKPELALKYSKKLFEIDPESPDNIIMLAMDYAELSDYEKASEFAAKAFLLKSDDSHIAFSYGRIMFLIKDFKKAKIMLNKSYNMKNSKDFHGVIWGNLGHIALFEKEVKIATEYYKKCVREFDDINDFSEKFDTDLPYALKNGISKTEYERIKQDMIEYWRENN